MSRERDSKKEGYEIPKEYWYIDCDGEVMSPSSALCSTAEEDAMLIGNIFNTKEEAERAVEKLRAFKRLKDKGFRFEGYDNISSTISWRVKDVDSSAYELQEDLGLLFSGGEE